MSLGPCDVTGILLFEVNFVLIGDGQLFFSTGGGWKIFTCKHPFFIFGSCCKQSFSAPRFPANTIFTCIQFISVFTASANNLFQTIL